MEHQDLSLFIFSKDKEFRKFVKNEFFLYNIKLWGRKSILKFEEDLSNNGLFILDFNPDNEKLFLETFNLVLDLLDYTPFIILTMENCEWNQTFEEITEFIYIKPINTEILKATIFKLFPPEQIPEECRFKRIIEKKWKVPVSKLIKQYNFNYRRTMIKFKKRYHCTPGEYSRALCRLNGGQP